MIKSSSQIRYERKEEIRSQINLKIQNIFKSFERGELNVVNATMQLYYLDPTVGELFRWKYKT